MMGKIEIKYLGLDDDSDRVLTINKTELIKIISETLEDEKKVHNLDNFQRGLVCVGIIKGLAFSGVSLNPFMCAELVRKVGNGENINE